MPALSFGLRQHVGEALPETLKESLRRLWSCGGLRLVRHLAVQLIPVRADRYQIHIHARVYDSIRRPVRFCSAKMPRMRGSLLLAFALITGDTATATSLTLELRVFNGVDDVTSQTRISVHRAGERTNPVVQLSAGHALLAGDVPPGIYDVQAIREREGRVLNIRWAQRLVVMPYPDEDGRHLEVINFQNGFGALQLRRGDRSLPEAGLYHVGEHTKPVAQPIAGADYLLFIVRAGPYDLQTSGDAGPTWQIAVEVPLDRTRLWIVPQSESESSLVLEPICITQERSGDQSEASSTTSDHSDAPPAQQVHHDDDERDHQQDVNQRAGNLERKSDCPQHEQNDDQHPEH
jgi:hypothetical protein